jgi:hypothetical protein
MKGFIMRSSSPPPPPKPPSLLPNVKESVEMSIPECKISIQTYQEDILNIMESNKEIVIRISRRK